MKKVYIPAAVIAILLIIPPAFNRVKKAARDHERAAYEQVLKKKYLEAPVAGKSGKNEEGAKPDQPDMAAYRDYLMTFDPATGTVPRERLLAAYTKTRQLNAMKSDLTALAWQGYGAEMGGRTRAIMYDPNDPSHKKVWAAGVTGGLWYNMDITNANSLWNPVDDFWPMLSVRCITYDPNNTQVMYIGTGEPETAIITYRESSGLGQGIWKSTDGGSTWSQMPSTAGFEYIPDIVVRNEGGNSVIYAAVNSGLYHGPHLSQPSDGLFRSADNGVTWTQVLPVITGSSAPYAPSDVELGADGRIFVGTRPNVDGEGGATLLYSDSGLQGSWSVNESYRIQIESDPDYPLPGRVVIASSKTNPGVVYALVASGFVNPANNFKYFYCFNILKSTDKGQNWTEKSLPNDITSGINFATIAWHALDIAVDPNNDNHVYIGGLDMHHTTDGGDSWTRVSDWSLMYAGGGPAYIHADQHIIVFKPGSSDQVLFGTDGGVFYTAEGTSIQPTFEQRNSGYNTLQFYTCAINPLAGLDYFYGGLQDNGTLYYTGSPLSIFDMVSGGDGACCFYDEDEPNLSVTSIYYNQYYIFSNGGYINGLYNWSSGTFVSPADYDYRRNAIYANAVDYVGNYADNILRLTDLTGSGNGQFLGLNTGSTVPFSAITYSPYSTNADAHLFAGTDAGRLFRITHAEGIPVVTEITGNDFPLGSISSIAVGKSEDTLLVTFSNYGVPSVWQTVNGGQNWTDVEGNLPDMPVRWALYHPQDSRHALIATETGVWATDNLNEAVVTWVPAVDGMANVRVDMLRLRKSDNTVLAASHGRGLFTAYYDITEGVSRLEASQINISPNPSNGHFRMTLNSQTDETAAIRIYSADGREVWSAMKTLTPGGSGEMIDISANPGGTYLVAVTSGNRILYSGKVIKY